MTPPRTRLLSPVTLLVVVVSVMVTSVHADVCDKPGYVNGCSTPFGIRLSFQALFTASCNRHDICYSCGAKHDVSRRQCDSAFLSDMKSACIQSGAGGNLKKKAEQKKCIHVARIMYYFAVRLFGSPYYHKMRKTESHCDEAWVTSCLP
ncbi:conodipine-P2-like [Babylonia areolata]|uniref:conodipine-P2-like n=1 Tax=Babylonia areolata TaxID=304850 RepID=UPI003FD6862D